MVLCYNYYNKMLYKLVELLSVALFIHSTSMENETVMLFNCKMVQSLNINFKITEIRIWWKVKLITFTICG